MKPDNDQPKEDDLDAFFAAARSTPEAVSDDLHARLLRDAEALRPKLGRPVSWSERLRAALGGWPAMGGLTAAMACGMMIGLYDPTLADFSLTLDVSGTLDSVELLPGDLMFFEDEEAS